MIKATSKNKMKRSRPSPESKNSFVKHVTSTVSSLWPSSITKWFATSQSSKANGSTTKPDSTDSSSEDDIPETSVVIQPPPKRMRYNSPKVNHLGQSVSEVNSSSTSGDAIESYDIIEPSSNRNHIKMEPNYVSTPIHTVINEPSNVKRERETTVINTPTNKRKSLQDMLDKVTAKQEYKELIKKSSGSFNELSEPHYKASLTNSPFYRGKLIYGGAASSYMNIPNITTSRTTRVNETINHDNNLSNSTRRVMDLLEHYSSPLSEAKRISLHVSSQINYSYNKTMENTCSQCKEKKSYKSQMLHLPSIASMLSLKRRLRLMDTTKVARQLIASQSSGTNYMPYPNGQPQSELLNRDNSDKLTTKIKKRVTRIARGDNKHLVNDLPTPIKLPNVVFEIDQNNLPKFNFGNPVASTPIRVNKETIRTTSTASLQTATKELSNNVQSSELKPSNDSNLYKFATPVIVSGNLSISLQEPKFSFKSPMQDLNTIDKNKKKETSQISITEHTVNPNTEKPKDWKCSDCWVNNKPDASNCVCCSAKKPSDDTGNTCSICQTAVIGGTGQDKCFKCKETQKSNANTFSLSIPLQNSNTWKCGDCWVLNSDTAEKCVCCGLKNPKLSETIEEQTNESDWKCNDCWIKNKHNIEKCIACGGVKPNSGSNNTTISFLVKAQIDKWDCSNCLVRNNNDKTKCVCCDHEKTGVKKEAKTTSFNFGINSDATYKFGIDPKDQVNKFYTDTESQGSLEQSFVFGLPVNKIKDYLPVPVSNAIEAPKLNFSFGIPKQTTSQATNQTTSNILQIDTKVKEATPFAEEKPQEVPTINFISSLTPTRNISGSKSSIESGKSPQESLLKMVNPIKSTAGIPGMVGEEKKLGIKPVIVQSTTNTETRKSNTFSFAKSGIKFASNLFSASTTTMDNGSSVNKSAIMQVPITTSSPLFLKSDLNVNPSMFQTVESAPLNTNIFQNPATTSNEATVSTFTTPSKLFSFRSKPQSSLPEPSQPKFDFSFGNTNKTDPTPVFNATFRINKEPNANPSSNKFTHSTNNKEGSNPSLSVKPLVTGNFITTENNSIMNNASLVTNGITTVNPLNLPDLGNNPLNAGNTLKTASMLSSTPSNGIFGGAGQKENIWLNTNNSPGTLFESNGTTNSLERPATFTFGSSTPDTNNNPGTTFGNNTTNAFSMQNPTSNASLFSASPQTEPNVYGNTQTSNSVPTMGSFGGPNPSNNTFNIPNSTTSIFEEQAQAQAQAQFPTQIFNFGTQQPGTPVFGFGQQSHPGPGPFQAPVYNFGTNKSSPQFNMGTATAPNPTSVRRVRKAVRRAQR